MRGARRQQRLDALLRGFLDRPLADHVHVASAQGEILVLAADTPVWGHRIRYLAPAILEQMREQVPELVDVHIIVRPRDEPPATPEVARRAVLSRASASLLETVAGSCDNPPLARVLARMSAKRRERGD